PFVDGDGGVHKLAARGVSVSNTANCPLRWPMSRFARCLLVTAGLLGCWREPLARGQLQKEPTEPITAPVSTPPPAAPLDGHGDPLPDDAIRRIGTVQFRQGGPVHVVLLSQDGKVLVSGGEDEKVCIWDPATGKELRQLPRLASPGLALAMAPDGKMLASGGPNHGVAFWDPATSRNLRRWYW